MADEPEKPETPPQAAADKPASHAPGEPLKGEVSRTNSPGAGASAAPGELLMENPIDWLKLRQAREESDIE